jgi:hypothetical protein
MQIKILSNTANMLTGEIYIIMAGFSYRRHSEPKFTRMQRPDHQFPQIMTGKISFFFFVNKR